MVDLAGFWKEFNNLNYTEMTEQIKEVVTELGLGGFASVAITANTIVEKHQNNEMIDWTLHTLSVVATTVIAGVTLHLIKKLLDHKPKK